MKDLKQWLYASLCVSILGFGAISCSSDDDNDDDDFEQYDFTQVVTDYANKTVIATYADMKSNGAELKAAVADFQTSLAQDDLNKAAEAWKRTRKAWECSEAFLFGPAESKNLDPALDSWPLDKAQLDAILADDTPIADVQLTDVTSGFHTLEYLLFRDGGNRSASEFTNQREVDYLVAVTNKLYENTADLHDSWANEYKTQFLTQPTSAMEHMLDGISGIADEVGNGKIADPYKSKDVLEVESWYSWNSLTDFKNNIRSIENSYMGGYDPVTRGANLSDYIKSRNADLDTEVRNTIQAAIDAIDAIPEPFRDQLDNPESADEIEAAMDACNAIMDIFDEKVKALVVY